MPERELNQLRFIDKLFLLSILDQHAQEHIPHEEFIDWEKIKYLNITPNYFFQHSSDQTFTQRTDFNCQRFC